MGSMKKFYGGCLGSKLVYISFVMLSIVNFRSAIADIRSKVRWKLDSILHRQSHRANLISRISSSLKV